MAARVAPLRDDDIGAGIGRLLRLGQRLHLTDNLAPGVLDAAAKRGRIAARQHDRGRPRLERHVERRGVAFESPKNKTDPDPRVAGLSKLLLDSFGASVTRTDHS